MQVSLLKALWQEMDDLRKINKRLEEENKALKLTKEELKEQVMREVKLVLLTRDEFEAQIKLYNIGVQLQREQDMEAMDKKMQQIEELQKTIVEKQDKISTSFISTNGQKY